LIFQTLTLLHRQNYFFICFQVLCRTILKKFSADKPIPTTLIINFFAKFKGKFSIFSSKAQQQTYGGLSLRRGELFKEKYKEIRKFAIIWKRGGKKESGNFLKGVNNERFNFSWRDWLSALSSH